VLANMIASGRPLFTAVPGSSVLRVETLLYLCRKDTKGGQNVDQGKADGCRALLCVLMPGVMSSPALVINDARVPAENYAPANAAG
jgi:hypothetical protein